MADDSEWQALPLDQQLGHKLWKARAHAYEQLAKQFELAEGEDDAIYEEWNRNYEWPKKAVTDANAVAQEKGVHLVSLYARLAGRPAARCRGDCMPPLVDKCLAFSARKGTRDAAIECVLGWCEAEADADKGEGVVTALVEGLGAKQPKVVAGAVAAMNAVVSAFGTKTISPKPLLKTLPKIFGHADKTVRAEGTAFTTTLYTFLGPALEPSLGELKPVQVKELHEAWAVLDGDGKGKGSGKPTRETAGQKRERLQREAQEALEGGKGRGAEEDGGGDGDAPQGEEEPAEDIDPYDLADPVAVLSKLPNEFYAHLGSSKWKERKEEALDPLLETLKSTIKIKPDHYEELVKALAGRMSDANILCVIGAAGCLEQLAKGLRNEFGKYKSMVIAPMLEKFKEKKANVVEALCNSLDAIAHTIALSDLTEDWVAFSKHKNPAVKEQNARFLVRTLRSTRTGVPKADVKPLTDLLLTGMDDAVVPVRDSSAEGLGTLMKLVGPASFQPVLGGLDDIRKGKVQEYFEKAEVQYKPPKVKPAPVAAKPKPAPKAPPKPKAGPPPASSFEKENEPEELNTSGPPKLAAKPPARLTAQKSAATAPPVASAPAPAPKKPAPAAAAAPAGKAASKPMEPIKYKMSQEEAEARAAEDLEADFVAGVGNSVWKTRLAAMDGLLEWLPGKMEAVDAELIVRFLNKKPGPKESNFQVWQRVFQVYSLLAEQSPSFSKACMALSIPALTDKYGDAKIKEPANTALVAYAEKSSLGFVLSHAFEPMTKQKAVKMQAENFVYVENALREFGIVGVPIRDLIEFLKSGLKSANAAVRSNATKALVTTKLCVGADISNFLQDLNSQLLTTIEAEFSKIAGESPPVPTRTSVDNAPAPGASGGGKGKGKAAATGDPLDELYPRVELDKLLSNSVIKACDDSNWKARKEALETMQGVLEANKRLKPGLGSDIVTALKSRMVDANLAVKILALDVIKRIATGMGKPFDRVGRPLLGPIMNVLADKNAGARSSALAVMTATAEACGLDILIAPLGTVLETPKPELRSSALGWLGDQLKEPEALPGLDLALLAKPVISCLEDRNPDVRKNAQAVLPVIVVSAGYATMMDHVSALKPASRGAVQPLIDAARANAPAGTAPAPKAAPSSAAAAPSLRASTTRPPPGGLRSLKSAGSRPATPDDQPGIGKPRLGMRRPGAPTSKTAQSTANHISNSAVASASELAFRSSDLKAKQVRAAKETGPLKWVVDASPRKDQIEQLHVQMGPHVSGELLGQLFSKDHHAERDFMAGLGVIESWAMDPAATAERVELDEAEVRTRLAANADLIFKYITIRLCDTNTSITMKCLDLIEHLFGVFQADSYRMSDYEASALLPSLINKSGDSKEVIRARIRGIYKLACTIYPFSKVFTSLLENGLKSKNARARAESAEELSALFQRQGLSVCQPAKALPAIASLIGDRDSAVRNGALSALASAYASAGDSIHKYITNLSGKEQDMLNERLKRTEAPASPRPPASTGPSRPESRSGRSPSRAATTARIPARTGLRRPSSVIISAPSEVDGAPRSPASRAPVSAPSMPPPASPSAPPPALPGPSRMAGLGLGRSSLPSLGSRMGHIREPSLSSANGRPASGLRPTSAYLAAPAVPSLTSAPDIPINEILSSDDARSAQALKSVQMDIEQRPEVLVRVADALIDAVATQMRVAFEGLAADTPQSTLRLCKHLMQTLSTFFDQLKLATAVSKETLIHIISQLTQRLQETADNHASDAIVSLSKVLNLILIRIFHNSDRSACFGALFEVLRTSTIDIRNIIDEAELTHRAKYAELVMKCLWKVSKTAKESLEDGSLDTRVLLKDIDDFLVAIPPAEWRRRATDGVPLADMPLRTVKTILQQVVSIHGEGVYDMLSLIQNPDQAFTYQYLFRLLNNSRAAADGSGARAGVSIMRNEAPSPEPVAAAAPPLAPPATPPHSNGDGRGSHARTPSTMDHPQDVNSTPMQGNGTSQAMAEVDLNNTLTEVFAKIGHPNESKQGMIELYHILKANPEAKVKVDRWMGATGTYFQAYVRRTLKNLATEDEEVSGDGADTYGPFSPAGSTTPRSHATSKVASMTPPPSADGRVRTMSREQDLTRLQSLFGFSQGHGESNGNAL